MIDPSDTLEVQVAKQARIIDALIRRTNREHGVGSTAYSLFQSAIALQGEVWAKTRDLERALDTLGRASNELRVARDDRERTRSNLADALAAMEGGFALFTDETLQVCNELFRTLLPDIADRVVPGLAIQDYFAAVEASHSLVGGADKLRQARQRPGTDAAMSIVIELADDRWYQLVRQRTHSDNIVVLQTEITEIVRKNRSEKDTLIDRQASYLQAAFDHMSLGICTFSAEGTILLQNARFAEILSLPYALAQKGTVIDRILDHVRQRFLATDSSRIDSSRWRRRLRTEGRLQQRLRLAGGEVLDLHVHSLPDGGFLVDVMDVTLESQTTALLERRVQERTVELTEANARLREQYDEQARVEEELRVAKEQAEAAVSSKTRFLAAASHDLLQPINAAKLLISTLARQVRGTALSELVERLDGSFTSTEKLLHALLDISRLESTESELKRRPLCLEQMMRTVREDTMPLATGKRIRLDVVPSTVWVESDPQYLARSVQNLVVNAIQYTEAGGRVLFGCRRRGDRVVLEVWDTGMGISLRDQKRIFEEFTSADNVPPGSGMGLGLSIVDRTCRHLGHAVTVRSKPGMGSVFAIEMATIPSQRQESATRTAPLDLSEQEMDLIVLVIENDQDVLYATTLMLETWGASPLAARSTAEAVALARSIGMPPDLILADYQLDGADTGLASIRELRRIWHTPIPAIMITAGRDETLVQAAAEDDVAVLRKPVQLPRLRSLIGWKTRSRQPAVLDQSLE